MHSRITLAPLAVSLILSLTPSAFASSLVLQDFETDFAIEKWPPQSASQLEFTSAWRAQGERSLKVGAQLLAAIDQLATHDWRPYTTLRFTVHNTGSRTVRLGFELQDQHTKYYDRHQDGLGIEPGVHVIEVDLTGPLWRGEQNRPFRGDVAGPMDLSAISRVSFYNHGDQAIYIDDMMLLTRTPPQADGAVAFDFGPVRAPSALGWDRVTPDARSDSGGFGFVESGAQTPAQFMSYPTTVLGDGVAWPDGGFATALDGGPYIGWVAFERGGFWEDQGAAYRAAALSCNGVVVHEHEFAPAATRFLFQDVELTDMADLADQLIWPAHGAVRFGFQAAAGNNVFRLDVTGTRGLPLRVAALALAPDTPRGHAYLATLEAQQRRAVHRTFGPLDLGRRGQDRRAPTTPIELQQLAVGEMVYPRDWPKAQDTQPTEILAVAGQRVTVHLGVYAQQAGDLTVAASTPSGLSDLPIPSVSYGRYLPMRPYGTGVAWLEVNHYRPDARFDAGPELTRSLLVEYDVPADAQPGRHHAEVLIRHADGALARWPVHLRVLRVPLPQIPIPVGLFMNALSVGPDELPEATWWRLQESLLEEQGLAGLNCLTGGPGLRYDIVTEGGVVDVQGDAAIRYIQLAQRFVGVRAVVPYGGFLPHLRNVTAAPQALADAIGLLERTYDLPPHYVYAYDEPGTATELQRTLDYLRLASDSKLRTIGYTSWHDDAPEWQAMVDASYAPALNLHTGAQLSQLRERGKEPWVYNNGLDRLGMGLRLWRSMRLGASGRLQWIGLFTQGFAFHNLDGREPSRSCFLVHDQLGVLATPVWLATREGLLDLRLRLALEQLAPDDDPTLQLWTVEGYKQDEAQWPDHRLDSVRRQVLQRLAELSENR